MNFFDHQATARKKSFILLLLFVVAVVLIVTITNLICFFILSFTDSKPLTLVDWFSSRISLSISATITITILVGTIHQFINLSKGGQAVADMAKARKVDLSSRDQFEQRFVNLVEEMSIASGTMMPELYVMDHEQSINAFVAGYEPTECVLVITKGAMEKLSRDELQGIIGHEFSHVLNGDMRINIRLIAVLAGILLIGQIGQFLMRSSFNRSHSYRSNRNKNDIASLFIGITLICIGYTGLFLGRVIKAAISRQREFLADAASVQFTRNPEGIAAALYKVIEDQEGSQLQFTRHAEDLNHLCFSESIKLSFSGLLASHPPLEERITTIDTSYLVRFKARKHAATKRTHSSKIPPSQANASHSSGDTLIDSALGFAQAAETSDKRGLSSASTSHHITQPSDSAQPRASNIASIEQSVGTVSPAHIDHAIALLDSIPDEIKRLAHTPEGARSIVLLLMLNETAQELHEEATKQLSKCAQESLTSSSLTAIHSLIKNISIQQRTPIYEISISSLRSLDEQQRKNLVNDLSVIANTDKKITFFEFALLTLTKQQLTASYGHKVKSKYHSFKEVSNEIALIMRLFSIASSTNRKEQQSRFTNAIQLFSDDIKWEETPAYNARSISHALNKLRLLSPLLKQPLIDSFIECVMADNKVSTREYELLRLVAVVLDCPIPPLLTPKT